MTEASSRDSRLFEILKLNSSTFANSSGRQSLTGWNAFSMRVQADLLIALDHPEITSKIFVVNLHSTNRDHFDSTQLRAVWIWDDPQVLVVQCYWISTTSATAIETNFSNWKLSFERPVINIMTMASLFIRWTEVQIEFRMCQKQTEPTEPTEITKHCYSQFVDLTTLLVEIPKLRGL